MLSIDTSKNNVLIKHSSAIHVTNNVSAIERKVSNILLKNAYSNLSTQERHSIQIREIAQFLGWQPDGSYNQIKECLRSLIKTTIEWNVLDKDKKNIWTASSFISSATIKGGNCTYSFSPELRTLFASPNIYARLNMLVQAKIGSKHSLALWEFFVEALCSDKKQIVVTEWISIEDIKTILAVKDVKAYEEFKVLNRDIIKKSLDEINTVSDIDVSVCYKRENRRVVALSFTIRKKIMNPPSDPNDSFAFISEDLEESIILESKTNDSTILQNSRAIDKLKEYGIAKSVLSKIIKEYSAERITEVIEYVENKKENIENPKGFITKALKEDWVLTNTNSTLNNQPLIARVINLEKEPLFWRNTLELLIQEFGKEIYISWFSKIKFDGLDKENNLLLKVETVFLKDWIKTNYLEAIARCAKGVNKEVQNVILINE